MDKIHGRRYTVVMKYGIEIFLKSLLAFFLLPLQSTVGEIYTNEVTQLDYIDNMYNVARDKLDDLTTTEYWDHTSSTGEEFLSRTKTIIGWKGENLYKGPCDLRLAMDMFEESPAHKAIFDHEYNNGIFLLSQAPDGTCYLVVLLADKS